MDLIETRDALNDLLKQGIPPHTPVITDSGSVIEVHHNAGKDAVLPFIHLKSPPAPCTTPLPLSLSHY